VFAEKISRILDQFNIVSETIVLPIPDFGWTISKTISIFVRECIGCWFEVWSDGPHNLFIGSPEWGDIMVGIRGDSDAEIPPVAMDETGWFMILL
jgi:hypothetical protein